MHTVNAAGMDDGLVVRMDVYSIVALLGMFLVRYLANRFALQEVRPWKEDK